MIFPDVFSMEHTALKVKTLNRTTAQPMFTKFHQATNVSVKYTVIIFDRNGTHILYKYPSILTTITFPVDGLLFHSEYILNVIPFVMVNADMNWIRGIPSNGTSFFLGKCTLIHA